ncbi:MAG: PQQ-binding-like beta-propeller repeat protein [Bacteroidales bacterium]|jgi:outer membrane protein assembly factor BamB|nr:PQQ-binding-like beta-propeller repeat protein [Bacteroidales bacterium]
MTCLEKNRNVSAACFIICFLCIISCKKKEPEPEPEIPPKVFLTVVRGQGVEGNPATGVIEFDTGMVINYGYRAIEGYINLVTTLDGNRIPDQGSFIIRKDLSLNSEAEQKVLWRYNTSGGVYYCVPAIGPDKTIYYTSGFYLSSPGAALHALKPDGTLKWSYPHTEILFSPVIGNDGNIYVQDFYSKLYSFTPAGALRWIYDQFRHNYSENIGQRCPAIGSDGTIYVAGCGLHAVNPVDGSRKWVAYEPLSAKASPSVGPDGTIYAVFSQDSVVAVTPGGTAKWSNSFTYPWEMSFATPAIDDKGVIYFAAEARYEGTDYSNIYAFSTTDGAILWKYPVEMERFVRASPVIDSNGNIIIATKANGLNKPAGVIALSPSGQKIWSYTIDNVHVNGDDIYTTPSIDNNGLICFAAETGFLYVLNPDGTLNYKYELPVGVNWSSPAIVPEGIMYIGGMFGGNYEGSLVAVKITGTGYASTPWPRFRHDNFNSGRYGFK